MPNLEPIDDKDKFLSQLNNLRPDLFFPEEWTDEKREAAVDLVRPNRVNHMMFSAIPMSCKGPSCIYASTCPLLAKSVAPIGKPCPIEMSIVHQFTQDYIDEFGVDENNRIELGQIRELVDQEVQWLRKTKVLADEHFIQENVVGLDQDGAVVTKKELHAAVAYEDAIARRKERLLKSFLATREARMKAGQGALDSSQTMANMLDALRERESEQHRLLMRKLGREYHDDYIDAEVLDDPELPSSE